MRTVEEIRAKIEELRDKYLSVVYPEVNDSDSIMSEEKYCALRGGIGAFNIILHYIDKKDCKHDNNK